MDPVEVPVIAANNTWLVLHSVAHNLGRWTARLGALACTARQTVKTLRQRYLTGPARPARAANPCGLPARAADRAAEVRATRRCAGTPPWPAR